MVRPRLAPSLTDLVFLAILFFLFLADPATGWERLVRDGDTGLHTRIGDWILDHWRVPKTYIFSFALPEDRWLALQWLSGVIYALLNRAAGLKGIVWLSAMTIALYHLIVMRDSVRRGANGIVAIVVMLVAANASLVHAHARPHLFTLLFLAITSYLMARDRESNGRAVWIIVPLMTVWANLHSAYPVGLALIGAAALGDRSARYARLTAAAAAATLINPNGLALFEFIAGFASSSWVREHVGEYKPPVFASEQMYLALALLIAGAIAAIRLLRERRWTEVFWLTGFGAASLMSARHMPLYLVVAVPIVAVEATRWWKQSPLSDLNPAPALAPIGPWTAAIAASIWFFAGGWPADLSAKMFPRDVVHRNASRIAASRVFTEDQWADYLIWTNYPVQQVFFDGRSDVYVKLGDDYLTMLTGGEGWQRVAAKWKFDTILTPLTSTLAAQLDRDPTWRLLDRDGQAALYVKAGGSSSSGTALQSADPSGPGAR